MARKKKGKRNDSRGYGAGPAPLTTTTTASSSQQHYDGMKSLLDQMKGEKEEVKPQEANVISDRFVSRLQSIVDRLEGLSFTDTQIEMVIKELQYSITLESALDWLCLHLPTLGLPPLFTDGRLRQAEISTQSSSGTLTVLRVVKPESVDDNAAVAAFYDIP